MIVRFTILGQVASKANSRRLVTFGRGVLARPAIIKSESALAFERAALMQIPTSARVMFTSPVRVTIKIFYANERSDLDESVLLDVLQARYVGKGAERHLHQPGVYGNDRQVREKHIYHAIDRANPRAEIEVEEIHAGLFPRTAVDIRRRTLADPSIGACVGDPF